MRQLILIIAVLFSCVSMADVRSVFRFDTSDKRPLNLSLKLKRMTFGLSDKQIAEIKALTGGKVDFSNYFYLDHSEHIDYSSVDGFSIRLRTDVPPPAIERPIWEGDPSLIGEWWIERLGVKEAWLKTTGKGVVVADCDAGFYHDESDLRANMLIDLRYDLADKDQPDVVNDGPWAHHGTAVSAIIAGVRDGQGTNGIAYNSQIVPLQNFNYDQRDDIDKEEATAACVLRALNTPDVDVIVIENQTSTGSSETFRATRDAVRLAIYSGIHVVSAAGNYRLELIEEMKDDTGSIIVGALSVDGSTADFSNFGSRVTLAAYGENLLTLYGPDGKFGLFGGTSGATPQVAAAVALMIELNPLLTPEQMRSILQNTRVVEEKSSSVGGRLAIDRAVAAAQVTPVDLWRAAQAARFRQKLRDILN